MLGVNSYVKQGLLKWDSIKNMDEAEVVLVNSNRLYSQLSVLSRLQTKKSNMGLQLSEGAHLPSEKTGVEILTESINKIQDEKQMYVCMRAGDVRKCFETNSKQLPINTFRAVHCKDKERKVNEVKQNHQMTESPMEWMYRKRLMRAKKY